MTLLRLDGVSKRFGRGGREQTALRDVQLQVAAGELVAVWGRRRSGRTTLLQVAAGVERPSDGSVRFGGVDLARRSMLGRPGGLAYVSTHFVRVIGETVLEHVGAPVLGGNASTSRAQSLAFAALRGVGAVDCADAGVDGLDQAELIRVAIARALVTQPRLLVLDEPTQDLRLARDRDQALELLRSLARRDGIAMLMTVAEAADLAGADRALTIDQGELRGLTQPAMGQVVELRRSRS
ncbi:MAG TPA: ATP-binding cassette domain-containing protein [Conexibacter sp.]|nr:ATP-binding cassette domain-containing protein [Conexibacter sp.]